MAADPFNREVVIDLRETPVDPIVVSTEQRSFDDVDSSLQLSVIGGSVGKLACGEWPTPFERPITYRPPPLVDSCTQLAEMKYIGQAKQGSLFQPTHEVVIRGNQRVSLPIGPLVARPTFRNA